MQLSEFEPWWAGDTTVLPIIQPQVGSQPWNFCCEYDTDLFFGGKCHYFLKVTLELLKVRMTRNFIESDTKILFQTDSEIW